MYVNNPHSEKITKALCDFYYHAKNQGPITDRTALPEQGDDTHYYELDARVVEPLLILMEENKKLLELDKK